MFLWGKVRRVAPGSRVVVMQATVPTGPLPPPRGPVRCAALRCVCGESCMNNGRGETLELHHGGHLTVICCRHPSASLTRFRKDPIFSPGDLQSWPVACHFTGRATNKPGPYVVKWQARQRRRNVNAITPAESQAQMQALRPNHIALCAGDGNITVLALSYSLSPAEGLGVATPITLLTVAWALKFPCSKNSRPPRALNSIFSRDESRDSSLIIMSQSSNHVLLGVVRSSILVFGMDSNTWLLSRRCGRGPL